MCPLLVPQNCGSPLLRKAFFLMVGDGVIVDGRNIWAKIDFTGTDVACLGIGRQSNVEQVQETYAVELAG